MTNVKMRSLVLLLLGATMIAAMGAAPAHPMTRKEAREAADANRPLWRHPELRRVPTPEINALGDRMYTHAYEHKDTKSDRYTTLAYTTTVPASVVLMDDLGDSDLLHSVSCENGVLILHGSDRLHAHAIQWNEESAFVGGPEWGCLGNDGSPASFFRKASSTPLLRDDGALLLPSNDVAPWDILGETDMRFFTNDTLEDHDTYLRHVEKQKRLRWEKYIHWPGDPGDWGYGVGAKVINWNFNEATFGSQEPYLEVAKTPLLEIGCEDCHAYAAAGVGFEFETKLWAKLIANWGFKLTYLQLWVEAGFSFSMNAIARATGQFSESGNLFLNPDKSVKQETKNVNIETKDPGVSPKILKKDIKFSIGPIPVTLNWRVPTYLRWDLEGSVDGEASAGVSYSMRGKIGVAYLDRDCRSSRCKQLRSISSCKKAGDSKGWCNVFIMSSNAGGNGPQYTMQGSATAKVHLTPIIKTEVWGGLVNMFARVDPYLTLQGNVPCAGLPPTHPSVDVSLSGGAQVQIWGSLDVKVSYDFPIVGDKTFRIAGPYTSPRWTVLTYKLDRPILDMCFDFVAIANKLIPAKARKAIEKAVGGLVKIANTPIEMLVPVNALKTQMEELVVTLNKAPPMDLFTSDQLGEFLPVGDIINLTPHGTEFLDQVEVTIPFNTTLVADCAQVVISRATSTTDLDWTELLGSPKCDMVKGLVTFLTDKFSVYTAAVKPLKPPTLLPEKASVRGAATVTITADPGSVVYYTTDGSTPTTADSEYEAPIVISEPGVHSVRAFATIKAQEPSPVVWGSYLTAEADAARTPDISPTPGPYVESVAITISSADADSVCYFCINCEVPDAKYTKPIFLASPAGVTEFVVRSMCSSESFPKPSFTRTDKYVVTEQVGKPILSPGSSTHDTFVVIKATNAKNTPDVTYHYTLDGTKPDDHAEMMVNGVLNITDVKTTTLTVRATKTGLAHSEATSETYTITARAQAPTVEPEDGIFVDVVVPIGSCATPRSSIVYTTDGTTPTPQSPKLVASSHPPFGIMMDAASDNALYGNHTLSFMCISEHYHDSEVIVRKYDIRRQVEPIEFSPTGGDVNDTAMVSLTTATPGAVLWYTQSTQLGANKGSWKRYESPIKIDDPGCTVFNAFATYPGYVDSRPTDADFFIIDTKATDQVLPAPAVFPPTGLETSRNFSVTVTECGAGVNLYFSHELDGKIIGEEATPYETAFVVGGVGKHKISVWSERQGFANSPKTVVEYTIATMENLVVDVSLVLGLTQADLPSDSFKLQEFNNTMAANIASALEIHVKRVRVASFSTNSNGELTMQVKIFPDDDQVDDSSLSQEELKELLEKQAQDPNSVLRQGDASKHILSLDVAVVSGDESEPASGLSLGVIIAIAVAAAIVVAAVIMTGAALAWRRRNPGQPIGSFFRIGRGGGDDDVELAQRAPRP